jgi:hypothetical protein
VGHHRSHQKVRDLDTHSKIRLKWVLLKGRILCGKTADEIYKTHRGFHIVFRNIPISFEKSLKWRKLIGDDSNRIFLDSSCPKKPKQVLFAEKKITRFDRDGNLKNIEIFKRERIK